MRVPELYGVAVELASRTSEVLPLSGLPGCWLRSIECRGLTYWMAINGHDEPKACEPEGQMLADVPPFTLAFWCNGWLLGFIDAAGGVLMASGRDDNTEAELVAAIKAELEKLPEAIA